MARVLINEYIFLQHRFYELINISNDTGSVNNLYELHSKKFIFMNMLDTNGNVTPKMCLAWKHTTPEYEYDWEERLQYYGENEEYEYIPIIYSPFSGEAFQFDIQTSTDITSKISKLLADYVSKIKPAKTKRIRYSNVKYQAELFKNIQSLTSKIAIIAEWADSISEEDTFNFTQYIQRNYNLFLE